MSSKIVSIVGARPQFVKAAMVSRALAAHGASEVLVHTGQHFDANMSSVFFAELEIPAPQHHLRIAGAPHGAMTGRMLEAVERVLEHERPDQVVVFGDTNSTLAGALAAVKLHLPVAHVEAGLRSFNRRMPEEINRVLTDHIADLLFAPTETAVANLRGEGRPEAAIRLVGDVMYDACLHYGAEARASGIVGRLGLEPGAYTLATIHRAENTDDPARLRAIVEGLNALATKCRVVWPLHPRTRAALARDVLAPVEGVRLLDPLGFLDMVALEKAARLIATDSGGVQKEAFFHRVPCVTLRDETEWVELIAAGWNGLCPPTDGPALARSFDAVLEAGPPSAAPALFGDGHAAEAIAAAIVDATAGA